MRFDSIIFHPKSLHSFADYGIKIPLLNTRVLKTIDGLDREINLQILDWNPCSWADIKRAHSDEYAHRAQNHPEETVFETYELVDQNGEFNRFDPNLQKKPMSDFIEKARIHVEGTFIAGQIALERGTCYHLGGGMHHAMSFKPGGFCMFNDLIIAAKKHLQRRSVKKILILDLDCHRGDGTAECAKNEERIDTFSIHMKYGWPLNDSTKKESFIPGTFDIEVANSKDYIPQLKKCLEQVNLQDYSLVYIVHGVDVWEHDALLSSNLIKLTSEEVLERDLLVFDTLKKDHTPQAWVMGGGYGDEIFKLYLQFLNK